MSVEQESVTHGRLILPCRCSRTLSGWQWWASVVQFLQRSSIVEAEKNAREVMQVCEPCRTGGQWWWLRGSLVPVGRLVSDLTEAETMDGAEECVPKEPRKIFNFLAHRSRGECCCVI